MKLAIKHTKKEVLKLDNSEFLDVTVTIFDGETPIEDRKFGFPLDTPIETIHSDLTKFLSTYESDRALKDKSERVEDAHKNAENVMNGLVGVVINEQPKGGES